RTLPSCDQSSESMPLGRISSVPSCPLSFLAGRPVAGSQRTMALDPEQQAARVLPSGANATCHTRMPSPSLASGQVARHGGRRVPERGGAVAAAGGERLAVGGKATAADALAVAEADGAHASDGAFR